MAKTELEIVFQDHSSPKLSAGDLVILKSGGPMMVVVGMDDEDIVICRWEVSSPKDSTCHGFPAVCLYKLIPASV